MNKQFTKYLLKSNKALNVFLLILNIIFSLFYFLNLNNYNEFYSINLVSYTIVTTYILIILECIILPIIELSFLHSRKRLDVYLALPIDRKSIIKTTIIEIIIKIFSLHIITLIPIFIANFMTVNLLYVLLYFVISLIIIISFVCFISGICLKTNSTVDAIFVTVGYLIIPLIIYFAFYNFGFNYIIGVASDYYEILDNTIFPFSIINLVDSVSLGIVGKYDGINYDGINILNIIVLLLILLYGLFMVVTALKKFKAEKSECLSNDILAYPTVIFLATMSLMLVVMFEKASLLTKIMYLLFIYVAYSIMTFIYQRKIIFTKKSLLIFIVTIMISFGFISFAKETDGFGLNYSFINKDNMKEFNLYYNISISDDGYYNSFNVTIDNYDNTPSLVKYIKEDQTKIVDKLTNDISQINEGILIQKNLEVQYGDSLYSYYCDNNNCLSNDYTYIIDELKEYESQGVKFNYSRYNYDGISDNTIIFDNLDEFAKEIKECIN